MFKISLFENAIDELKATHMYVESFLDWRNEDLVPDIEKLFAIKQMIKHLSSSWELLMKYRIQKHDYRKVFEEPSKITDEKLKTGDFHTIRYKTAIKILNSYGIKNSFTHLKELHTYRNQIEHYQIEVSLRKLIRTSVWSKICHANKANITWPLKRYFKNGLKDKNQKIVQKLEPQIIWEEDHPWWDVFKEELKEYPDIKYEEFPF